MGLFYCNLREHIPAALRITTTSEICANGCGTLAARKRSTQLSLTQVDEEHRRTPSSSMLGKKTPRRSGTGEVNSARLSLAGRELRALTTSVGPTSNGDTNGRRGPEAPRSGRRSRTYPNLGRRKRFRHGTSVPDGQRKGLRFVVAPYRRVSFLLSPSSTALNCLGRATAPERPLQSAGTSFDVVAQLKD